MSEYSLCVTPKFTKLVLVQSRKQKANFLSICRQYTSLFALLSYCCQSIGIQGTVGVFVLSVKIVKYNTDYSLSGITNTSDVQLTNARIYVKYVKQ